MVGANLKEEFMKILTAIISSFIIALAGDASAIVVKTPAPRSATQNECLAENPNDHQAYLACIQRKKSEQKGNSASQEKSPREASQDNTGPQGKNR